VFNTSLLALVAGCLATDFQDGQFLCDPGAASVDACPEGLGCARDGRCRKHDVVAPGAGGVGGAGGSAGGGGACVAKGCADLLPACGMLDDGCGATLACGCPAPSTCGGGKVAGECGCPELQERSPTAAINAMTSGAPWQVASGVLAGSDDARATASAVAAGATSQRLRAHGFSFAVPDGAVIEGFEVSIERSKSGAASIEDESVLLMKNLDYIGSNLGLAQDWGDADAVRTYGAPSNLWGATWTPAEVRHYGFGVQIRVRNVSGSGTADARVDHVVVRVHYACPPFDGLP
jgi:hypothetical protein